MIKSRRLREKREEKLPVIIYTEYPETDRIERIKEIWVGSTSWPCIILGPGEKIFHPEYINYDYRKV
jgi:hypothetical protein